MPTDELRHARPRWLMWMSFGIRFILAGGLLMIAFFAWRIAAESSENLQLQQSRHWIGLVLGLPTTAVVMGASGVWMLTRPEGRPTLDRADRLRRWAMRLVSFTPTVGMGLVWAENSGVRAFGRAGIELVIISAVLAALCPLPALLFFHLRSLARRVLDPHLAEHCAIVGWGASLLPVLMIALIFWNAKSGNNYSALQMWLFLAVWVAAPLFLLWGTFLMWIFSVQFARASRAARRAWIDADLSLQ